MIIRKFESIPFTIKLKKPFKNSNMEVSKRQGFIIKITDDYGNIGYGEASPLPGLSTETFNSIIPIVKEIERKIIGSELNSNLFYLLEGYPSVQFGVSQALHSIFILRGDFKSDINNNSTILVNGVVAMTSKKGAVNEAKKLFDDGFGTIKVKVGRDNIEDDIALVKSLYRSLGDDIKYRLDANGKWDVNKTLYIVEQLRDINIEYIEQPVKSFDELKELSEKSKTPIAVDESIRNTDDVKTLLTESYIKYFVIKPSLMGSITDTINLINMIEKENRNVIISSAFESSIGRSTLVFLAALVNKNTAHGLAVGSYLNNDLAEDPYPIINGKIKFDNNLYPPEFNLTKLK